MNNKIKIFVVEDHPLIIQGLRAMFEAAEDMLYIGSTSAENRLTEVLAQMEVDIVLMDIGLPGKSGLELCRYITETHPAVKVIALSTSSQAGTINKMISNGAAGYLMKDAPAAEIIKAITDIAAGKNYFSFSAAKALQAINRTENIPAITNREKQVLELIANGLTNAEIAKALFLTPSTIDTHRTNMLLKFKAKNTAELVKLSISKGLLPL